ncbi:hypothetical protein CBR_g6578 [Chara braunii]|uniref:Transcriptional coactivator p15 (PC4) C-terminal domain-containing protein n=1 Tax=Chara braunii TaxID=69332 RepID=A0A388KK64_CHABU|nr:hypothetical protein CBR_g6578 [Chara braunii]|eukprot:GBG70450.1 hypothetical protein CBR_g6578 [Chara braunii]
MSSKGGRFKSSEEQVVCQLTKNRRVTVKEWQGKPVVDIRDFYEKEGEVLPTRKGIMLAKSQWDILVENLDAVDEAIKELQ